MKFTLRGYLLYTYTTYFNSSQFVYLISKFKSNIAHDTFREELSKDPVRILKQFPF